MSATEGTHLQPLCSSCHVQEPRSIRLINSVLKEMTDFSVKSHNLPSFSCSDILCCLSFGKLNIQRQDIMIVTSLFFIWQHLYYHTLQTCRQDVYLLVCQGIRGFVCCFINVIYKCIHTFYKLHMYNYTHINISF